MRLYPNCYYRKAITKRAPWGGLDTETYRSKQLSTSNEQDIQLMNADILRHDPFQHPHHED